MELKPIELTKILARFIAGTGKSDIPLHVFDHAKVAFKDWLGVTFAGKEDPLVKKLIKYADMMGGNKQSTLLGYGMRKSACQAALINGSASHVLDYDDTLEHFLGHPSVTIFPSILALSEWMGKSGTDFLLSYLIGLKVGAVIGACAGLDHYMTGCHPTSTIGHFASAASSAKLLGLDEKQTLNALGVAGTQASGLKSSFGTMSKAFHAGKASQAGLIAALLAGDGFTGAEDIIEGAHGFFKVFKGTVNEDVVNTIGKTWEIENLAQKYHASCHATHSPIEAARSIILKEGIKPNAVKSIRVFSSELALSAASKMEASTGLEGKFCISYCVANAILRENTGMQAFTDEKINDPEVKAFMKKITANPTQDFKTLEARVEIETDSGKTYTAVSDILKLIPELTEKKAKISAKFVDLCTPVLGSQATAALEASVDSLENIDNMQTSFVLPQNQ
ncbi:MAG: MmgE/PrpD family protein [Deltaproteobacteria bacterium]|nr:MmgE/PrpD family protein [Deltaproteobacteria bacterium]